MLKQIKTSLLRLAREDSGQSIVEYALVVALIALAVITSMGTVATALSTGFSKIASHLNAAIT